MFAVAINIIDKYFIFQILGFINKLSSIIHLLKSSKHPNKKL